MIRLADILHSTAEAYGLAPAAIRIAEELRGAGPHTVRRLGFESNVEARHVVVFLARRLTRLSRRQIGQRLAYRDASSASIFAEKQVLNRLPHDDELRTRVAAILGKLVLKEVASPLGQANPAIPALLASLPQPANEAHPQ